ncbi:MULTISPECIES: hypothetical protein [Geodermatophilus]|uniref:Uncharacterized protein n=1 Tax=Geodermatophilus nigrescens TaxID=1070870 RepID=A0A1M5FP49_9ACTN|nr:hypothetical protein [Geodermatophilus nigrescens]SHF93199.1 hypothetical protein SAMN05444351_1328 [Geodermatophilus nigrescens]
MTGPYLYDEGPEALHTGTPRRRNGLILAVFGATLAVGVGMVVALPLVKGSGDEQAREAVGVFTAALAAGDTETAGDLLCEAERDRADAEGRTAEELAVAYAPAGGAGSGGEVTGVEPGELDGKDARQVGVRWDDGSESTLLVVLEDGPRVCGTTSGD